MKTIWELMNPCLIKINFKCNIVKKLLRPAVGSNINLMLLPTKKSKQNKQKNNQNQKQMNKQKTRHDS